MLTQYEYYTLPYKYNPPPRYFRHIDHEMFMAICELIKKLSMSLGGTHDSVDRAISDRLNKVIVGLTKDQACVNTTPPPIKAVCKKRLLHSIVTPPQRPISARSLSWHKRNVRLCI